ncbi:MAG: phosphatase PAP2 family protein [Ilumatobacteraceae bacterium]
MAVTPAEQTPVRVREHHTAWWKEVLIISSFYALYTMTRNRFGSIQVSDTDVPLHAFNNAMKMIRVERALGLYHEETIQEMFLAHDWFIKLLNTYYGTAHFAVTIGVFIVLYRRRKDVFPLYRNALAAMTGLAIVGFALFPLMPPRLLDAPCPPADFGGACIAHEMRNYNGATNFGFVDTLDAYGGPWDFDDSSIAKMSNQYAAMPSLHIGWASWCAFGMFPLMRKRWTKIATMLYPASTLFTIVVTGNHYWIDGIGGLVVLGLGFLVGGWMHTWNRRRLDKKFAPHVAAHPATGH